MYVDKLLTSKLKKRRSKHIFLVKKGKKNLNSFLRIFWIHPVDQVFINNQNNFELKKDKKKIIW
jgi:hypothetical protein